MREIQKAGKLCQSRLKPKGFFFPRSHTTIIITINTLLLCDSGLSFFSIFYCRRANESGKFAFILSSPPNDIGVILIASHFTPGPPRHYAYGRTMAALAQINQDRELEALDTFVRDKTIVFEALKKGQGNFLRFRKEDSLSLLPATW